jgi:hypothetical protein
VGFRSELDHRERRFMQERPIRRVGTLAMTAALAVSGQGVTAATSATLSTQIAITSRCVVSIPATPD